jgi:hypothetical protein
MVSNPAFQLDGERTTGQDVRTQNVTAVSAIANIVKTSLGPVGLDKASVTADVTPAGNDHGAYMHNKYEILICTADACGRHWGCHHHK